MKLYIPKITLDSLYKQELEFYNELDNNQYGKELAIKVANKLIKNSDEGLYHSHKDYCGLGLFIYKDNYTLSDVYDGYGVHTIIATFGSKTKFGEWLSKESDQSMSLFGKKFYNQTITKIRLDWYLEADYSPVWNTYCAYLRKIQT